MENDEQEIRQLDSTWMAASKAGDVETVLSLMSDDVVFLVPGQPVTRKPILLLQHELSPARGSSI